MCVCVCVGVCVCVCVCVSVCELVVKADFLSDHNLPFTCHLSPSLTTFASRSSEVRRLLLNLDPYGGTDILGCFLFFLRELMLWPPVLV